MLKMLMLMSLVVQQYHSISEVKYFILKTPMKLKESNAVLAAYKTCEYLYSYLLLTRLSRDSTSSYLHVSS